MNEVYVRKSSASLRSSGCVQADCTTAAAVPATPQPPGARSRLQPDAPPRPDTNCRRPNASLLERAEHRSPISREVRIGPLHLPGTLSLPPAPRAIVVFAHGSGSSRLSPRNRQVAAALNQHGLATVLFDLLTEAEAEQRRKVFDIALLTERLGQALAWRRADATLAALPCGLFGASTGAAAALGAAARYPGEVYAVVARGGRPDLAGAALAAVLAPTLLIVGAADHAVLDLNRVALASLHCRSRLAVVPGATHLFEEPGALTVVAGLAADWLLAHLPESLHASP